MRVVLDTNVIVSAFLSSKGAPALVLERWALGQFEVLVSQSILMEYERALSYHRVQVHHKMSGEEVAGVIEGFRKFALQVEAGSELRIVREDPEDDKFLECAVAGGASYMVTGDSHLLAVEELRGIHILTPAAFLTVLAYD